MPLSPIQVVQAFVAAINRQDAAGLAEWMTDDHTFIDSGGTTETGRDKMRSGWEGYFQMFPDYRVTIGNMVADGDFVAAFGSAFGTYNGKRGLVPENRIEMPAAWRAIVENGKVKLWQVYADWSEGGKIIEQDQNSGDVS